LCKKIKAFFSEETGKKPEENSTRKQKKPGKCDILANSCRWRVCPQLSLNPKYEI
jgi:hypothetical protein